MVNNKKEMVLYVSTNGNDLWSGKFPEPNLRKTDGPFLSITCARDFIRKLKKEKGLKEPITVMVREGIYFLDKTIVFTPEDSGTEKCPITYRAYPGEKVILSGGKRITSSWKVYKDKIMVCSVQKDWRFRQLFVNGKRQIRTRTPNYDPKNPLYGGWTFAKSDGSKTKLEYEPGIFKQWENPTLGEINIFPKYGWWNNTIPIRKINRKKHIIILAEDTSYEIRKGDRFRVENLLEELDQPGEWCLDWEKGELYFWPLDGCSLKESEIIAPKLGQIIKIQGKNNKRTEYINISGFTFTQTVCTNSAVYLEDTENCSFRKNLFYALGGEGLYLEGYNKKIRITGNEFAYLGKECIQLSGTREKHPVKNIITYNHCHHCGIIHTGHAGTISLNMSGDNLIAHNLIHDMPRMGISICDYGKYGGTDEDIPECAHNIIEYNELYDLNLETCDTGGIYTNYRGKRKEGNIIRYNIIKNMVGCYTTPEGKFLVPYYTWGIYLDDWSSNMKVYGNICIGNVLGGIHIHGGRNNLIKNNIFVNGSEYQIAYNNIEKYMSNNKFIRNIVYYKDPKAKLMRIFGWTDYAISKSDYNVFFNAKKGKLIIEIDKGINSFSDWQKKGFDKHSLISDPLFVDPEKGDFSLKKNSPAFKLGFKPINIDKIRRFPMRSQVEK